MKTTTVFMSGNSQAVRLPKDFQVDDNRLQILRVGDDIVLRRVPRSLADVFSVLRQMPPDFMAEGREDPLPEERESL
ncbi:MAG: antitoxin [Gammaproteobacteria bacterium]|jgi:antitoxin VapB|nr:antitoxin [Gammaproteobacteria bacterium]